MAKKENRKKLTAFEVGFVTASFFMEYENAFISKPVEFHQTIRTIGFHASRIHWNGSCIIKIFSTMATIARIAFGIENLFQINRYTIQMTCLQFLNFSFVYTNSIMVCLNGLSNYKQQLRRFLAIYRKLLDHYSIFLRLNIVLHIQIIHHHPHKHLRNIQNRLVCSHHISNIHMEIHSFPMLLFHLLCDLL